jgi:hypothetical protein
MIEKIPILKFHQSQPFAARQFEAAFLANRKIAAGFIRHNQKVVFAGFFFLFSGGHR